MTSFIHAPRARQIAARLLLAFLVIALTFAWLPQPVAAKTVQAPTGTTLAGFLIDNTLVLNGAGFLPQAKYQVKVRVTDADPWTKIAKIQSSRAGRINAALVLPSAWANLTSLQVCLKEKLTGRSRCITAKRQ
jgi:hypothetical protein